MYKTLYSEKKQEYQRLKNRKGVMLGGGDVSKRVIVVGYEHCPYYKTAAKLASNFPISDIRVVSGISELEKEYDAFLSKKYNPSTFKMYNQSQRITSPLVIVYENEKPVMYGGCDTFREFKSKYNLA